MRSETAAYFSISGYVGEETIWTPETASSLSEEEEEEEDAGLVQQQSQQPPMDAAIASY